MLVMGPWVHGGWTRRRRRQLGDVTLRRRRPAEFYREQIELPFFEHHLKGEGEPRSLPEAWVFETGTNRWRRVRRLAAEGAASRRRSTSTPAARLALRAAAARAARGDDFDEYVSDPAEAGAVHRERSRIGMTQRVHDRRPALRRAAARRARLPDRAARRGRHPRRADRGATCTSRPPAPTRDWVVKLIDVYPDDYPRSGRRTRRGVQHGRLSAAGPRRRDARQVPQQLREAGAVRAGQADDGRSSRCRTCCHTFRTRPPDHGAGAEHLVPARGPQPADVRAIYTATEADFQKATNACITLRRSPHGSSCRSCAKSQSCSRRSTWSMRATCLRDSTWSKRSEETLPGLY